MTCVIWGALGYRITYRPALPILPLFSTRHSLTTWIYRIHRQAAAVRCQTRCSLSISASFPLINHLFHYTRVNHLSTHVCLWPSLLLINELIRVMHYGCNSKVLKAESVLCIVLYKKRHCPSAYQPLQAKSSQGSISQPVLSSRRCRDGSLLKNSNYST